MDALAELNRPHLGPVVQVTWEIEDGSFPARLHLNPDGEPARWNGWLCPAFDRETAQRIVDFNAKAARKVPEMEIFRWDGDTLISCYPRGFENVDDDRKVIAVDWDESPIEPIVDDEGVLRWSIGAWEWTWQLAD